MKEMKVFGYKMEDKTTGQIKEKTYVGTIHEIIKQLNKESDKILESGLFYHGDGRPNKTKIAEYEYLLLKIDELEKSQNITKKS